MRINTLLSGEYDSDNAILRLNAAPAAPSPVTGAAYFTACTAAGLRARALRPMCWISWTVRKRESNLSPCRLTVRMHMDICVQSTGCTVWCVYLPLTPAGKRQTSFVSCDVMPNIEEDIDIEVNPDDIRVDTYRSSGAGGQHINKTSSAIRITHFPTGIVVTCQNERSQFQNKDKAMQMLKAKLLMVKQEEQAAKAAGIRGDVKDIGWGKPDTFLCAAALYHGQRPPYRRGER